MSLKYKDETCVCGSNLWQVSIRVGAGGSGTYIKLKCKDCGTVIDLDFDNPNYEG